MSPQKRNSTQFDPFAMDATDRPQIVEHVHKSLTYVVYDTRWVPSSARMVVLGCHPRGTGALQVFSMTRADLKLEVEVGACRLRIREWREAAEAASEALPDPCVRGSRRNMLPSSVGHLVRHRWPNATSRRETLTAASLFGATPTPPVARFETGLTSPLACV